MDLSMNGLTSHKAECKQPLRRSVVQRPVVVPRTGMCRLTNVSVYKRIRAPEVQLVCASSLVENDMVITLSKSAEHAIRAAAEREPMADPDPRSIAPTMGGADYSSPTAFEDVLLMVSTIFREFRGLHSKHCWRMWTTITQRPSAMIEVVSSFGALTWMTFCHACGETILLLTRSIFIGEGRSRQDTFGMSSMYVRVSVVCHMARQSMPTWRWSSGATASTRARSNVANLCSLPAGRFNAWRGQYIVHDDAMFWNRAIIKANFRYED